MTPGHPGYRHPEADLESALGALESVGRLTPATRGLALASAAAALGRRDLARVVLRLLLDRGVPAEGLREALLQTYLFAGYPRAINALAELAVLAPLPEGSAVDLEPREQEGRWLRDGRALCRRVYGQLYERLLRTMGRISPDLGRWMVVEGYGMVLSRPGLSPPERELCAVAALLPLDVPDQLRAHLRGALLMGASREEVLDAVETAALLAPEGRAEALRLLAALQAGGNP